MTNKYENGKIYKIETINGGDGDIYIGSTIEKYLSVRLSKHKSNYKGFKNGTQKTKSTCYVFFEKYGVDNCVITLLETVNCNSKEELLARERYYIQSLHCLNKNIPLRTRKEWKKDTNFFVKYYADNKTKLKQYCNDNKEKIKQNRKLYYQTTKSRDSETFVCECGSKCWVIGKNRHFQSKKHQDFINQPK
jgi:hypothetical protein